MQPKAGQLGGGGGGGAEAALLHRIASHRSASHCLRPTTPLFFTPDALPYLPSEIGPPHHS